MNVCVFGASSDSLAPVYYEEAEALGRLLADAGHTLVFGGGAGGLMGACARGAQTGGGRLVGIAPRYFDEPGVLLKENAELILTDTMAQRKEKMLELSKACITLPGGIGTMDEFFETVTLAQLGRIRCRLALLNTAGFYLPLWRFLEQMTEQGFLDPSCLEEVALCDTPEELLSVL